MSSELEIGLDDLKKNHLDNLKLLFSSSANSSLNIENTNLKEYYEYISNKLDYDQSFKAEQIRLSKIKTNDRHQAQTNKIFNTNYNLEYCEHCKLAYWPNNCQVFMIPKIRISKKNAKVLMKYKLFGNKPIHKSYKDNLLNKIINQGNQLIYQCKRCQSKNIIYKEKKRQTAFKLLKLNKESVEKNLTNGTSTHSVSFNKILNNNVFSNTDQVKKNSFRGRKKFSSLQLKLKQNELDQERIKNQQKSSGLFDFLQQLS